MQSYEQTIFISYAWGGEREEIVNQIDQAMQKRGIKITRDKRDLGYRGSIKEFMERIGQGNCVIVVVSDKYLRSKNCMFELVEIAENKQFADRIFPIILPDAKIYDAVDRLDYVEYWDKEKAKLNEKIRILPDQSNLQGIREELDNYDRFRDEISRLTSTLKDMNTLTPDMHRDANFSQLFDALVKRMQDAETRPKEKSVTKKERKTMDPVTLATAATTLLAPYIAKMGETAMEKVGEQLPEKVGKIWEAISNRFKNKPAAADAANDLAKNAEDTDNQDAFALQLRKALKEDEEFAGLLTELLEQAKSETGISNVGDGAVATNHSNAVGKIEVGGDLSGNIAIGNKNNQINNEK